MPLQIGAGAKQYIELIVTQNERWRVRDWKAILADMTENDKGENNTLVQSGDWAILHSSMRYCRLRIKEAETVQWLRSKETSCYNMRGQIVRFYVPRSCQCKTKFVGVVPISE